MSRSLLIALCAALLAAPAPAAAKELQGAKICGPDACTEVPEEELSIHLVEGGTASSGPERPEPFYRVRLTVGAEGVNESWWIVGPAPGRITRASPTDPGADYEWATIDGSAAATYRRLAGDLRPFAADELRQPRDAPAAETAAPSARAHRRRGRRARSRGRRRDRGRPAARRGDLLALPASKREGVGLATWPKTGGRRRLQNEHRPAIQAQTRGERAMRQIVTFGGGGFSMEAGNPLLDEFVLELTGPRRGRRSASCRRPAATPTTTSSASTATSPPRAASPRTCRCSGASARRPSRASTCSPRT